MTKKDERRRIAIHLAPPLSDQIKALAEKEHRSATGQVYTLMEEALAHRDNESGRDALGLALRSVPRLSALDIAHLMEVLGQALKNKLQEDARSVCETKSPNNRIALLVKEYFSDCVQLFEGVEGGRERLEAISEGAMPELKELPLIESCLPINTYELDTIYIQEFGLSEGNRVHQECDRQSC